MDKKNIEMIDELRKFVMRVLTEEKKAAPYELECAMEAAKIVLGFDKVDDCGSVICPYKLTSIDEYVRFHRGQGNTEFSPTGFYRDDATGDWVPVAPLYSPTHDTCEV